MPPASVSTALRSPADAAIDPVRERRKRFRSSLWPVLVTSFALGVTVTVTACGSPTFLDDPLHAPQVSILGPESATVPFGPLHRPGQPCAVCHREDGVAVPYLAAGTVYRDPMATIAVPDVEVAFVDSLGLKFATKTNCVGNFYVKPSEFRATFPIWVQLQLGPSPWKMESPIHREASCSVCHFDPIGPATAAHVFLTDDETSYADIPLRACGPSDEVSR